MRERIECGDGSRDLLSGDMRALFCRCAKRREQ
jgi:hypothetical protein